jgi:hypothetical protein
MQFIFYKHEKLFQYQIVLGLSNFPSAILFHYYLKILKHDDEYDVRYCFFMSSSLIKLNDI